MIDSHTHLDSLRHLEPDEAVANALAAGVHGLLTIGQGIDSTRRSCEIAARHPDVVRVAGAVHPQHVRDFDMARWPELEALLRSDSVVAIGETGLDQYRDYGPLDLQLDAFRMHMDLARETGKPLVIHTRATARETLDALAGHPPDLPVVLHCFSMTEELDEVLERGYYCSFAGNVTYPSAQALRDAAARIPRDRLLVETDAPYLAPVPMRGKPNEPAYVAHTLRCIAQVRGEQPADVDRVTSENAARLFGFPVTAAVG